MTAKRCTRTPVSSERAPATASPIPPAHHEGGEGRGRRRKEGRKEGREGGREGGREEGGKRRERGVDTGGGGKEKGIASPLEMNNFQDASI